MLGIKDLRTHDPRHFAATTLFIERVSDAIIRKMPVRRSDELERYKHVSPSFSQQTTELIVGKLMNELEENGTFLTQQRENEKAATMGDSETTDSKEINGGADGTRTRDLQRDRLAF